MCCILLIVGLNCLDYQDRAIYYSKEDNVCRGYQDFLYVKVNIDGKETVTHEAWGQTTCFERARTFKDMVVPASKWDDREFMGDYKISFEQETRRIYI